MWHSCSDGQRINDDDFVSTPHAHTSYAGDESQQERRVEPLKPRHYGAIEVLLLLLLLLIVDLTVAE